MRLDIRRAAILLLLGLATIGCGNPTGSATTPEPDAIKVVATTTVLADLVEHVGGPKVAVTSLVPKGGEVHTFDPTPAALTTVVDADLIVMNGLGLDEWLADIVADSGAAAPVVELAEGLDGVKYIESGEHGVGAGAEGGEHAHAGVNPHLWLNVGYARKYVTRITEALAQVDPDDAAVYDANARAYDTALANLDAEIREQIGAIPTSNRRIVSFHEAYPYFADAYGLEVIGTIVDAPRQDPSAGEIADLVEAIRASGAKAVFTEAQFSPDLAVAVASEAGVPVVSDLYNDSLGDPPVDSYEGMMRWNASQTIQALK